MSDPTTTSISLEKELLTTCKKLAFEQNVSLSQWTANAMRKASMAQSRKKGVA